MHVHSTVLDSGAQAENHTGDHPDHPLIYIPQGGLGTPTSNPDQTDPIPFRRLTIPLIIDNHKCISKHNGDGTWDELDHRWIQRPCKKKDCPRHWRRYAITQYFRHRPDRHSRLYWYHVRLSYKRDIRKGEGFQQYEEFRNKIQKAIPGTIGIAVFHRSRASVHVHVLIGSDVPIHKDYIGEWWKQHFPAKDMLQWSNRYWMFKQHHNPRRWLWYVLLGRKNKTRDRPPWSGIELRRPIGTW